MTKNEIVIAVLNTDDPKKLAQFEQLINGDTSHVQAELPEMRTCTITEASRRLTVSRVTMYRLIKRGAIKVVNLNGNSRVVCQSLIDYINGTN